MRRLSSGKHRILTKLWTLLSLIACERSIPSYCELGPREKHLDSFAEMHLEDALQLKFALIDNE